MADSLSRARKDEQMVKKQSLEKIVKETRDHGSKMVQLLHVMKTDAEESKKEYPNEPETHVKRTVHRTLSH